MSISSSRFRIIGVDSRLKQKQLDALFPSSPVTDSQPFDPELLYVECRVCGKPILWEKGKTTELLQSADINLAELDARCMLVSEGCAVCRPENTAGYLLAVVRVAGMNAEDALEFLSPEGNA